MADDFDDADTPDTELPALSPHDRPHSEAFRAFERDDSIQAVLIAMQGVLREMKTLGRKVDAVTSTVNNHATSNAVTAVKMDALGKIVDSAVARIVALENERDELVRSVLAKSATLVLVLAAGVAAALWIITHKAGG